VLGSLKRNVGLKGGRGPARHSAFWCFSISHKGAGFTGPAFAPSHRARPSSASLAASAGLQRGDSTAQRKSNESKSGQESALFFGCSCDCTGLTIQGVFECELVIPTQHRVQTRVRAWQPWQPSHRRERCNIHSLLPRHVLAVHAVHAVEIGLKGVLAVLHSVQSQAEGGTDVAGYSQSATTQLQPQGPHGGSPKPVFARQDEVPSLRVAASDRRAEAGQWAPASRECAALCLPAVEKVYAVRAVARVPCWVPHGVTLHSATLFSARSTPPTASASAPFEKLETKR